MANLYLRRKRQLQTISFPKFTTRKRFGFLRRNSSPASSTTARLARRRAISGGPLSVASTVDTDPTIDPIRTYKRLMHEIGKLEVATTDEKKFKEQIFKIESLARLLQFEKVRGFSKLQEKSDHYKEGYEIHRQGWKEADMAIEMLKAGCGV